MALVLGLSSQAATQSPSVQKKNTPKKGAPAPVARSSSTARKSGVHSNKKTVAARSRKASPPRQQTPTSDRYTEIQQALAAKGYYKGEANGVWSPDSVAALKRFQADQNLQADGKIGALSLIALGLGPKHESTGEIAAKPTAKPQGQP